ncbi:MAG: hypothetical protein ACYCUZ_05575 [Cuniculiplasma sp.]|jgi:hypothetical protein
MIDLDKEFPIRPNMIKIADCLVICSGKVEWIIEVKRSYLKKFLEQMEQTANFLSSLNNGRFVLKDSTKFLIIMERGLSNERLFEQDSNHYLKRKEGPHVKVNNKYKIMVWTKKEIDQVFKNQKRLGIPGVR